MSLALPHFYVADLETKPLILDTSEAHHATKVLRMGKGSALVLINGKGIKAFGKISAISKHHVEVQVERWEQQAYTTKPINVYIGMPKSPERCEWMLEKLTEIGVQGIIPLTCDAGERMREKPDRWHKIIVAAGKQSLNAWFPYLHPIQLFDDAIKHIAQGACVAHCRSRPLRMPLFKYKPETDELHFFIGPEGDFSERELALAQSVGACFVDLGAARLRTETAAVVGAYLFMQKWAYL